MAFQFRESQEKNHPIVSDKGNLKSNALLIFIQPFLKLSFTLQFLPGSNKTSFLIQAGAAANKPYN